MATHSPPLQHVRPFLTKNTFLGRMPSVVLDALMRKGLVRSYAKASYIYRRGEPGDSLMVVITGRIKLTNTSVGAKEVVLHFLGVGDIYGEVAALDGEERACDAVALEDTEVFIVYTRDLLPTLIAHPHAMLEVVKALCEKIRAGAAIIEDNTLQMRARVARGLLRLARQQRHTGADGGCLRLSISQEEFGNYLGLSRTNVNRQLGQLKVANMLKISGTQISITNEKGLAGIADVPARKG